MTEDGIYLVRFLDDPGPIKLPVPPARYTTSAGAVRGSWCLQVYEASAFPRGIQRNVDESRGAAVVSLLSRRRHARQFSVFLGFLLGLFWCFLRFEVWVFLLRLFQVFCAF